MAFDILPSDLCKIIFVSGNPMGDRLVRDPADTGTWLEEFRRLRLVKAPEN